MAEVLDFPAAKHRYWQCKCSCTTFHLREDGQAECAQCDELSENGGWVADPFKDEDENPCLGTSRVVVADGDLVRRRLAKVLIEEDLAIVVLVLNDGELRTWADKFKTDKERAWVKSQLAAVENMLLKS